MVKLQDRELVTLITCNILQLLNSHWDQSEHFKWERRNRGGNMTHRPLLGPDVSTVHTHKERADTFSCTQTGFYRGRMCGENMSTSCILETMCTYVLRVFNLIWWSRNGKTTKHAFLLPMCGRLFVFPFTMVVFLKCFGSLSVIQQ